MRQTTLSRKFNRKRKGKKTFKVAQVSIGKQSQLDSSILSQNQKERLAKRFRTNNSTIQGQSIYNSEVTTDIFRSEIVGVNESRTLMKKRVGKFSRLDRFRTRQSNNSLSKEPMIRKNSRSKPEMLKGASSVFDSISKRNIF
jgi:hypothetical protein